MAASQEMQPGPLAQLCLIHVDLNFLDLKTLQSCGVASRLRGDESYEAHASVEKEVLFPAVCLVLISALTQYHKLGLPTAEVCSVIALERR